MIIIYNYKGDVAVINPKKGFKEQFPGTEEERLIHIANGDLPEGTKFEVSPFDTVDMEDRTVGSDWIYKGTGRERTSVAFSEADQATYKTIKDEYLDTLGRLD